jgi:hypothetical protein
LASAGLLGLVSQKMDLFMGTAVRTRVRTTKKEIVCTPVTGQSVEPTCYDGGGIECFEVHNVGNRYSLCHMTAGSKNCINSESEYYVLNAKFLPTVILM